MGVALRVVTWLRSQGHEASHLREEQLHTLPDREIFEKAIRERRIVLTFDLDFGEIAALSSGQNTSVVLFRLHDTTSDHVIERLRIVLALSDTSLARGAIVTVEDASHRVRDLPIGRS